MILKDVYLRSVGRYAFRHKAGTGRITGVYMVIPDAKPGRDLSPRECYQVLFKDGTVDYVPFSSVKEGEYLISSTGAD